MRTDSPSSSSEITWSRYQPSPDPATGLLVVHVTCHMLHVTCYMCHMLHVTCPTCGQTRSISTQPRWSPGTATWPEGRQIAMKCCIVHCKIALSYTPAPPPDPWSRAWQTLSARSSFHTFQIMVLKIFWVLSSLIYKFTWDRDRPRSPCHVQGCRSRNGLLEHNDHIFVCEADLEVLMLSVS